MLHNRIKDKNDVITSIGVEKYLRKFNTLYDKISQQSRNRRLFQHNKGNIWQVTASIIHNSEKLKISFKSVIKQERPLSSLLSNIVLGLASYSSYVRKRNKRHIKLKGRNEIMCLKMTWVCV